jgi:hypothetical protein
MCSLVTYSTFIFAFSSIIAPAYAFVSALRSSSWLRAALSLASFSRASFSANSSFAA